MDFLTTLSSVHVWDGFGDSHLHFNVLYAVTLLAYRIWRRATLPVYKNATFWDRFRLSGGVIGEIAIAVVFGIFLAGLEPAWTVKFFVATAIGFTLIVAGHYTWGQFMNQRQTHNILMQYQKSLEVGED